MQQDFAGHLILADLGQCDGDLDVVVAADPLPILIREVGAGHGVGQAAAQLLGGEHAIKGLVLARCQVKQRIAIGRTAATHGGARGPVKRGAAQFDVLRPLGGTAERFVSLAAITEAEGSQPAGKFALGHPRPGTFGHGSGKIERLCVLVLDEV